MCDSYAGLSDAKRQVHLLTRHFRNDVAKLWTITSSESWEKVNEFETLLEVLYSQCSYICDEENLKILAHSVDWVDILKVSVLLVIISIYFFLVLFI